jgi:hypothetical protein
MPAPECDRKGDGEGGEHVGGAKGVEGEGDVDEAQSTESGGEVGGGGEQGVKRKPTAYQEVRRRLKDLAHSEGLSNLVMGVILMSTVFMAMEVPYALYPIPCGLYPIPYTLPYTLYPTPYTLHPIPYTL